MLGGAPSSEIQFDLFVLSRALRSPRIRVRVEIFRNLQIVVVRGAVRLVADVPPQSNDNPAVTRYSAVTGSSQSGSSSRAHNLPPTQTTLQASKSK